MGVDLDSGSCRCLECWLRMKELKTKTSPLFCGNAFALDQILNGRYVRGFAGGVGAHGAGAGEACMFWAGGKLSVREILASLTQTSPGQPTCSMVPQRVEQ